MTDDRFEQNTIDPFTVEPEVAADPEEREQESAQTNDSRYERELEADESERQAAVERLKADELPEPE